jgi:SAM-dependent methyltransferase
MSGRDAERELPGAADFCLKPGYRQNPVRTAEVEQDAAYWTVARIRASTWFQHPVYRICRELLRARRARSFLDVGCGPGTKVAELIVPHCQDLVLIDREGAGEMVARRVPSARFFAADLDELDLELGQDFDLIVCADVLEHLKDPRVAVRFIRAHLAHGGRAVLSTPERDHLRGPGGMASPHPEHVREWNAAEFRAFVESCGLVVELQLWLPQGGRSRLELALARRLGRYVLRRRWGACQALICRRQDSP